MATLTVWKFPTAGRAEEAIRTLQASLSADGETKLREAFAED
ncbi:MAG TPA: hypothetical protein VMU32_11280 [Solirubrobacteraceae bacterium]|nr:hypothetical protein [Solirubrobacteraceae bacterium]